MKSNLKVILIMITACIVIFSGVIYLVKPSFDLHSPYPYISIIILIVVILAIIFILENNYEFIIVLLLIACLAMLTFTTPPGNSTISKYDDSKNILEITNFENIDDAMEDVPSDLMKRLDMETALMIAKKRLLETDNLANSLEIDFEYSNHIMYKEQHHIVIPLKPKNTHLYKNFKGVPGYMLVNCDTQEAEFIKTEETIKYSPCAYGSKDLKRHIRSKFSKSNFNDFYFVVDDNTDIPYWVVPLIEYQNFYTQYSMGEFILVNAIDGDMRKVAKDDDDFPKFVSRTIDKSIIFNDISNWVRYRSDFSSQVSNNTRSSNTDYGYIMQSDGLYLYQNLAPYVENRDKIGLMLVNMITGKAKFVKYPIDSISSHDTPIEKTLRKEGYFSDHLSQKVPAFMKIDGLPVYSTLLKDKSNSVRGYVFISATNTKIYGYSDESEGPEKAFQNLKEKLEGEDVPTK